MILIKQLAFTLLIIITSVNVISAKNKKIKNKTDKMLIQIGDTPAIAIDGVKITLTDAIRKAISNNHDILSGSYDVAMSDSMYQSFMKKYSIFLNGSMGYKYQEYPESLQTMQGENNKLKDFSVSIMKMFSSATTISGGLSHEKSVTTQNPMMLPLGPGGSMVPLAFGAPEYHMPVFFLSIQQELLKNSFGYTERRQKEILKNVAKMQKEGILFQLSGVVISVIVDYWNVVINKTAYDNAKLALYETKKVRNIIVRNVNIGLSDNFNLNYYNMLVAGAEASLEGAKHNYKKSLRNFLSSVNLNAETKITGSVIFTDKLPEMNFKKSLDAAYSKRADYLNSVLTLKNAKMEYEIYSNSALPSVTAEVNVSSMAQRDSFVDSYSDSSTMSHPSYEARIKVTYPLDDREQKVNLRNAKYKYIQAKIQNNKHKRLIKDDIINKIEKIKKNYKIYLALKKGRIQSELFYKRMLISMRRGRLAAATVKNGVDAYIQSRNSEVGALVLFNISLLEFDVAKNELWKRYNIDVNKYIPGQKR